MKELSAAIGHFNDTQIMQIKQNKWNTLHFSSFKRATRIGYEWPIEQLNKWEMSYAKKNKIHTTHRRNFFFGDAEERNKELCYAYRIYCSDSKVNFSKQINTLLDFNSRI